MVVTGEPSGVLPLRRLLPQRELGELLRAFAPLFPGATLRVLDLAGVILAEQRQERLSGAPLNGGSWEGPLRLGAATVGSLQVQAGALPAGGEPLSTSSSTAAAAALTATLEHALAGAALRRQLAAETLERYREVHLAYRLGEVLSAGLDPLRLPQRVLDEALRVVRSAAALVVLDEADGSRVAAAVGVAPDDVSALEALRAARLAAAPGRSAIQVAEPAAGEFALRLWAPLRAGDRTFGGVLLLRPAGGEIFGAGDAKLLAALGAQAGTYVDNARLHQAAVEQARLARELQLAHEVQAQLMPSDLPRVDGWDVAAWWSAAHEVGGDFYDVTRQGAQLDVTVADVADKGMAAALFMALSRSVVRASAGEGRGPGEVLRRANALLCADASDGMFVTVAHAQLFPGGAVRYASGGHAPPLVARSDGSLETLARTGILLGWDAAANYGEEGLRLAPGDTLLLYTDGVTEARSAAGEAYGEARLERLVRALVQDGAPAGELIATIRTDVATFVGGRAPFDDLTLLAARCTVACNGGHGGRSSG